MRRQGTGSKPLTETDLLTFSLGIALLPGASNFLAPIFRAAPPGVDEDAYLPILASNNALQPDGQPSVSLQQSKLQQDITAPTKLPSLSDKTLPLARPQGP
jgi:acyl-homoserine-lactone acylase